MRYETKDITGKPNGYVVTIWNALDDPNLRPEQVYVTAVAAHSQKGPHLHMKRRGVFICVRGNVKIVSGIGNSRRVEQSGESHDYRRIIVPPNTPSAIYNDEDTEALVLNLPAPAWNANDPDDYPVENWDDV